MRGVAASLAILSAPWEGARLSTASAEPRRGARAREGGRRPWAAACGGAIFRGGLPVVPSVLYLFGRPTILLLSGILCAVSLCWLSIGFLI